MKHNLPLSLRIVRGAIGKEFVIKHYKYGVIRTKYPDMTRIVASMEQRKCRDLFREAVAYAKVIISDPEGKRQWQKRIRMRNGVYNAAIKFYMLKDKRAKVAAMAEARRLLHNATKRQVAPETPDTVLFNQHDHAKVDQHIDHLITTHVCNESRPG